MMENSPREFRVKASDSCRSFLPADRAKGRREKVSNSAPSFRRVVSSPYLRAPFFLSSCSSGSPQRVGKAGTRVLQNERRLLKALPLATDKTAEDPRDPLSKKLARNFCRSAQLLNASLLSAIGTILELQRRQRRQKWPTDGSSSRFFFVVERESASLDF